MFTHWWIVVSGHTIWLSGHVNGALSIHRVSLSIKIYKKKHTTLFSIFVRTIFTIILKTQTISPVSKITTSYFMIAHPCLWNTLTGCCTTKFSWCTISCTYNQLNLTFPINQKDTHRNLVVHQIHPHNLKTFIHTKFLI
jgi:hypothetical protein